MAKISALSPAGPLTGTETIPLVQDGETRSINPAEHLAYIALGAEMARDQAANLVLSQNVFVDVPLATAEAAVEEGTTFKLVDSSAGLADVRKRTLGGSTLLYQEVTAAALGAPGGGEKVGLFDGGNAEKLASAAVLTTGYAKYHGLHTAADDAARRGVIEEMLALGTPLEFNLTGTYQIDQTASLNPFAGTLIELHPDALLKSAGIDALAPVFRGTDVAGITIRGGKFTGGSAANTVNRFAIIFDGAENCRVEHVVVTESPFGGIMFRNTLNCGYLDPIVSNSLVYQAPPPDHSGTGTDIFITGGAVNFTGIGGLCERGAGTGIAIQGLPGDAEVEYRNISLTGWTIRDALLYAMLLYRMTDSEIHERVQTYGDLIDTVTGSIPHQTLGNIYGAGIYDQGFESAIIGCRRIRNTHSGNAAPLETLAPGAVGVINVNSVTVDVDVIEDCYYGVTCRDPSGEGNPFNPGSGLLARAGGRAVVSVGTIIRPRQAGIHQKNFPIMEISATVEDPQKFGIWAENDNGSAGRSVCERTILRNFNVRGGAKSDGTSTGVPAVRIDVGSLEYRAGIIQGYRGIVGVDFAGEAAAIIGDVTIDGTILTQFPLRLSGAADAGLTVWQGEASISGTTMTIASTTLGQLRPGMKLYGIGVTADTYVVRDNGDGTVEISPLQAVATTTITARLPAERSRISPSAQIICNVAGQATSLARPLSGIEQVLYVGEGAAADVGTYRKNSNALDNSGAPSVKGMYSWQTGGTTAIATLNDLENGREVEIYVNHALQFTHSAGFVMLSGANVAAVQGNVLRFRRFSAAVIRQVA